uniref:Uncharacterized protein LOC116941428 n=1 Tax=Petromyzon marinus TaxID=7757 RepID=A0AAJ7WSQ3_PETMA|nr:uncharacterized protein LOC116941428 [Petromyzon marinus]
MRHGERWDALCVSGWNASGRLAEELCQGAGCGPPKRDAGSLSPQLYGGDLLYPSVRCLGEFVSRCAACPVLRCSWESTATLACEPGPATTTDEVTWPRVRVLGGWGPCQGHLEALHAGSWRGVCAQALDASLACAQLQCPTDEVKVTEREIDPTGLDLDPYHWVAQAPCTGERGERGERGEQATHKCRDLLTWSDVSTCPGNRSAFISCRERSGPMLVVSWLIVSTAIVSLLALLTLRLVEWRPGLLSSVKGGLSATRDRLCLSRSRPRDRYSHPNPARWRGSLDYEAPGGAHSEAYGGAHSGAHGGDHSEAHGKAQWEAHGAAESGPQGGAHSGTHGGAHSGAHGGAHSEAHGKAQWEAHGAAERGPQGGAHSGVPGGAAPGGGTPAGTPSQVDRYSVTPVEEKERLDSGSSMLCDLAELNGLLSTHGYRLDSSLTPPPGYLQALRTLTRPHPPGLTPPPSYLQALRILSRPMLVPLATHDPDQRQDEEEEEEAEGGNDEGQGLLARPVIVHSAQPGRESLL